MIAGDAAHLMPVWQGQGYNSGIRDATNLGWKLAAARPWHSRSKVIDTYNTERRSHAAAMVQISQTRRPPGPSDPAFVRHAARRDHPGRGTMFRH